jgi:hypothetical protein
MVDINKLSYSIDAISDAADRFPVFSRTLGGGDHQAGRDARARVSQHGIASQPNFL